MPYQVRFVKGAKRPFKIVKEGGAVVGSSTNKEAAEASVRARMASERESNKVNLPQRYA